MTLNTQEKGTYFDSLGDDFELMMSDYDVERRQELVFGRLLAGASLSGRSVLEVGCGTGRFSRRIVALGGDLTVLDIGPNLVKAVSEALSCKGVVADACKLPFPDGSFDVVISSECIEHTPDPLEAIRQMCRVCRQGGTVCLTSPNKLWYPILWLSVKLRIRKFAGPERWISPGRARQVMAQAGMGELTADGCHLWPFQLKFTRPLLRKLDGAGGRLYPLMINFGIAGRKLGPGRERN
jgi:ubiquinone/menaquinone biosynthesis C-methylase UbiE